MVLGLRKMVLLSLEMVTNLRLVLPMCKKTLARTIVCITISSTSFLVLIVIAQGFIYRHLARKGTDKDSIHAYYEMGNELGKGTFATVMKGMNKESGDWFAVKIVHNAKVRGPNSSADTASFAREVHILQELAHPYICKFIEVFWGNDEDDTCECFFSVLFFCPSDGIFFSNRL